MPSPSYLTDAEHAGRTGTTPATTAERRLLGEVLRAIDAAEVAISRRAA
jgi:hypothetical protein